MVNQTAERSKLRPSIKTIYIILGLIVLLEVIIGLKVLNTPNTPSSQSYSPSSPTSSAPLSRIDVLSSKDKYKVGEVVPISITIDTAGRKTDGADLILRFDPKILEATPGAIKTGTIYGEYPVAEVDVKNGTIKISGISKVGQDGFSGSGNLATINFKAKAASKTSLVVDYTAGKTTDSNIVEAKSAKDILGQVNNLELTILP